MADMKDLGATIASQFRGLNGRHPGQWPLIPRLFCAVVVFVAVIAAEWFFYSDGQMDELDAGQQAEVKLREEFKSKVGQANNLDALREQKVQVGEYVQTLEKALPSKSEMDALLSDITHAGLGRGLQFEYFTSDIANLPRIVTLNNLTVNSGKDGNLTLDTVAKTFRYLDPDEVAQQRGGAKGGKKK